MAVSLSVLQVYDYYLNTYRNRNKEKDKDKTKSFSAASSRLETHNEEELKKLYSDIQLKNRFSPLLMAAPSPHSIAYAVYIKENAQSLTQTINSLSGNSDDMLFAGKNVYCDNNELAEINYIPKNMDEDAPESFELKIDNFATPQINKGQYMYADDHVALPPGNYSFDLINKKIHYELQFAVNNEETNQQLQEKIARLINNSNLGVSAKVNVSNEKNSAIKSSSLDIISDNCGITYSGKQHFTLSEESTTYNEGLIDYLGLNSDIHAATNAKYLINDDLETSYSNDITVFGGFNIKLNPNAQNMTAHIELKPDTESLTNNIETFVSGYNQFVANSLPYDDSPETTQNTTKSDTSVNNNNNNPLILRDMKRFLELHKDQLSQYGITINDDASLSMSDDLSNTAISDIDSIRFFGDQMLKKLDSITLDPMEYTVQQAYAYPNPNTTYINPYTTSIYTGLLMNVYV